MSNKEQTGERDYGHLVHELWGIILFSTGIIIMLALLSYHSTDKALNVYTDGATKNLIGPGGAFLADALFTFFGIQSLIIPLLLMMFGVICLKQKLFLISPVRYIGGLLASICVSILLESIAGLHDFFSFPLGGILGFSFRALMIGYVSNWGTAIIAISCLFISFILLSRISLFSLMPKFKWKWPEFTKTKTDPVVEPIQNPIALLPAIDDQTDVIGDGPVVRPRFETKAVSKSEMISAEKNGKQLTYKLPPLDLLDYDVPPKLSLDEKRMRAQAGLLEQTLKQFAIQGHVREIRPGPVVTMFEYVPAPGVKISRIASLSDDIAMAMAAMQVRIVAPIPGKGAVGVEIPNDNRETVFLKDIVADENFQKASHMLTMAIGKDIEGKAFCANLADMPHVLIAGTTGSGKSVTVNAMICSILYKATPEDVRFLMIDPKMLELSIYEGIPHLLLPPIIDSKKAAVALRWAVREMDRRYELMNQQVVREIYGYNAKVEEKLPFIVVVVDEYADLVAVAGKEVEGFIMRLAQKARACGIHVILATQRPSVDVITGVIKANFPVRMGFRLASTHDSKTIINCSGAERLLGRGDMLMMPPGTSSLTRLHGAFISEKELVKVVQFWKEQATPSYDMSIITPADDDAVSADSGPQEKDERYQEAIDVVMRTSKCSTSWLQRQMGVGYNRAARMVDRMEKDGVVGPILNAKGEREIFSNLSN